MRWSELNTGDMPQLYREIVMNSKYLFCNLTSATMQCKTFSSSHSTATSATLVRRRRGRRARYRSPFRHNFEEWIPGREKNKVFIDRILFFFLFSFLCAFSYISSLFSSAQTACSFQPFSDQFATLKNSDATIPIGSSRTLEIGFARGPSLKMRNV